MATTTRVLTANVNGTVYTSNVNGALEAIDTCHSGTTAPTDEVANGKFWLDTTTTPGVLKMYNNATWEVVLTTTSGALMDSELTNISAVKELNQGVSTTNSPTFTGLAVQAADLGTTAGDSIESLSLRSDTSNTDQMLFTTERTSAGSNWESAAHKMQRKVDASSMGYVQFGNSVHDLITFGLGANEYMRIGGNGHVGIGTTGPAGPLDIVNDAQRYVFRNGKLDCVNSSNTAYGTFITQSSALELRTSDGVTRLRVSGNGRVDLPNSGGSMSSSGHMITNANDTVGSVSRANGYLEWTTDAGAVGTNYFTSDERKKENIVPATKQSSDVIGSIQFIEFDWKPGSGGEGHVEVGVSAQQLQSIDPRLVSTLSDDTLMVNEPALVSHMAKALQEALAKIEAMEARLVALESV